MSNRLSFIKGITSGYIFTLVSMIISLWMVPFLLTYLSKPEYGLFAIAGDLLGWLSISSLGITSALNSKGAQLLGNENRKELNVVINTTLFTQLATSILIILVGGLILLNPREFFGNVTDIENFEIVVAILITSYYLQYINQPFSSLLVADKQIHIDNYLKLGLLLIQTALTVIFLTQGYKLLALAYSNFIANLIIISITWYRVKRSFPDLTFSIEFWRKDRMIYLLKNGLWFTVGGVAGILIYRMDAFLIGKYLSLTLVTAFIINSKMYQIAEKIHSQFFNTSRPYFAQMYGKGDIDKFSKLYNIVYYTSFYAAFIIGLSVYLISEWFIGLWVGNEYYLGREINLLLCVNFIIQAGVLPNRIILATSLFKNREHALTRIFDGILKLSLSVVFIKEFGVSSIIIAAIISSLIFSNLSLNYLSGKLLGEGYFQKLLPIIPALLILIALLFQKINEQFIVFSLIAICFTLIYINLMRKHSSYLKYNGV